MTTVIVAKYIIMAFTSRGQACRYRSRYASDDSHLTGPRVRFPERVRMRGLGLDGPRELAREPHRNTS